MKLKAKQTYYVYMITVVVVLGLALYDLGLAEIAVMILVCQMVLWHYYNDPDRTPWTWNDPDVERLKKFISNWYNKIIIEPDVN